MHCKAMPLSQKCAKCAAECRTVKRHQEHAPSSMGQGEKSKKPAAEEKPDRASTSRTAPPDSRSLFSRVGANGPGPVCQYFPCDQCYFRARSKRGLVLHRESQHMPKDIKCPHCSFVASVDGDMKRHIRQKHGNNNLPCGSPIKDEKKN